MPTRRGGFSLLEMLAATALVAGTLAPALAVMRDAMAASREGVRRTLVANYGVQVLESQSAIVMQNWANGTVTGNFSADGYATIKYSAVKSDAPANGGLTNRLMHLQVTAYDDANGNSAADAGEISSTIRTKVARLTSYINAPN
jgi:prepilin-type N-terminal cleavage/methylation domain-containing protein